MVKLTMPFLGLLAALSTASAKPMEVTDLVEYHENMPLDASELAMLEDIDSIEEIDDGGNDLVDRDGKFECWGANHNYSAPRYDIQKRTDELKSMPSLYTLSYAPGTPHNKVEVASWISVGRDRVGVFTRPIRNGITNHRPYADVGRAAQEILNRCPGQKVGGINQMGNLIVRVGRSAD